MVADRRLSSLLSDVPRYYATPEIRVDCSDETKFDVVRQLAREFERYDVIDVDGARVLFEDGWGLVRASNTQPALVLRAEAKTPQGLSRIKRLLAEALRKFPGVSPVRW